MRLSRTIAMTTPLAVSCGLVPTTAARAREAVLAPCLSAQLHPVDDRVERVLSPHTTSRAACPGPAATSKEDRRVSCPN